MIPYNLKYPSASPDFMEIWPRERWADEFLGIEEKDFDSE